MRFTKMHGIGNDYVYVNGFQESVNEPALLARKIADRHFGVGGDGLILVLPSDKADVRMQMFNADGSEAEMCGNGVRCVAKFAFDRGISKSNPMRVETGRGVLTLALKVESGSVREVTVNMREPMLALPEIPVDASQVTKGNAEHEYLIAIDQKRLPATFVSMGNPHAVMFVENAAAIDVERLGPRIEHHPAFPRRINAHWVQVATPTEVIVRTWERGSGITLACGTGACAVCVAGALTGKTNRKILAHLPGGDLNLHWNDRDDCVYMTGGATEIFSGDWPQ
jgi:diaminopimelate epimerase